MSKGNCTDIGEYCPELGCQMKRAASVHVDITSSDHKEGQYNTIIGV